MVLFDKYIVEDPVDGMGSVHKPNEEREGPAVGLLNSLHQSKQGSSYHNQDPNRGHPSGSDGCKRKSYLKYIHKLDDDKEVPPNEPNTNWTFTHGDLIHEYIQEMLIESLGQAHVENEKTVTSDINDDYYVYGHADIALTGLSDADYVRSLLPDGFDFLPETFSGFPDPFIIDIKTKSEFTYYDYANSGHARTTPAEKNVKQLNLYMGILGAKYGCLLYYSKRNDHLEEYWVEFSQELFDEAIQDITTVLDAVNTGTPPERDPDGSYMCEKFCEWYEQGKCPGMDGVEPHENWNGQATEVEYENPEWD